MAISWGAWEDSGGNGMRVGIDVSWESVSHSEGAATATVKYYTENRYSMSDDQTLNFSGAIDGTFNFHNGAGGSPVLRETRKYTYNYGANEYGSSPGSRTFTVSLSGAYNGVTPSKSVSSNIPARPIAAPAAPSNVNVAYVNDSTATLTWTNNSTSGEPYDHLEVQRWDNVQGWDTIVNDSGTSRSVGTFAGRQHRWRVRAVNNAGTSAWAYSEYLQTTPDGPSGASVSKAGTTSVNVVWANNETSGYDYTTEVEQTSDGGVTWTLATTAAAGTTGVTLYNLSPGAVYQFRVRAKSTVDITLYSPYSTTGTIQLQAPPAAPTSLVASRVNDNQMSLSWVNNPTTEAPYDSITVQRWSNDLGIWETVGSLGGADASLTDTATVADRKYQYRIRANNSAGSSAWVESSFLYTTPAAPSVADAEYTGDTTITVTWQNNASYTEYSVRVTPYKNDVAQTPVSLASGETTYDAVGIDILATYHFVIEAVSTVGSLVSAGAVSNDVMGAAAPSAPVNVLPNGGVADLARDLTFTWTHTPSQDGSKQKKYEVQHRLAGGVWASSGIITSAVSSFTLPAGTYANPNAIEVQVRTWGVHPDPSPWSATATITGSTTPTITLNSPGATIPISAIDVDWDFFDAEGTAQTEWEVTLLDSTAQYVLEQQAGEDATSTLTLETAAEDGLGYTLRIRARDGSGLWSDTLEHFFTAAFMPPAEVLLDASYDEDSGSMVLSLTPTADDGGVTTLPATAVTIERQIWNPETETYDPWEPVIERVDPDVTVIDTTAPIHGDGHYRVITYSAAPSSKKSASNVVPAKTEQHYVYVSGGENFSVVCRLWANVEIGWKASRTKAIHYFAGRKKPVMYSGEHSERVLTVSGLLTDGDSSPPHHWIRLAQQPGPVLLRGPHNRRILGALSEVSTERLTNGLHKVSFSIQEVAK
jgi:hypothetical protein